MKKSRRVPITVSLPRELYEILQHEAAESERTVIQQATYILRCALEPLKSDGPRIDYYPETVTVPDYEAMSNQVTVSDLMRNRQQPGSVT